MGRELSIHESHFLCNFEEFFSYKISKIEKKKYFCVLICNFGLRNRLYLKINFWTKIIWYILYNFALKWAEGGKHWAFMSRIFYASPSMYKEFLLVMKMTWRYQDCKSKVLYSKNHVSKLAGVGINITWVVYYCVM